MTSTEGCKAEIGMRLAEEADAASKRSLAPLLTAILGSAR